MIAPSVEARLLEALQHTPPGRAREDAARELFESMRRPLFQVCLRVTCNPTDAEDAVQQTFIDTLRGLPKFRGEARLSTWMFRIAIRCATRVRNRSRRNHISLDELGGSTGSGQALGQVAQRKDLPIDPAQSAMERDNAQRILRAMNQLPAPQRAVLGLSALDGMAQTEIAAILGVPVGTVYSRLHAARERLRNVLAPAC